MTIISPIEIIIVFLSSLFLKKIIINPINNAIIIPMDEFNSMKKIILKLF